MDTAGTVYVTDADNNRVLKLPAGSSSQTVLPFTGLNSPDGVAVDTAGNVYVTDDWQQPGGETGGRLDHPDRAAVHRPQLPDGVAVDTAGTVYVADNSNNRVLKLPAGSTTQTELPFTGLNGPTVWRWTPPATSTSPTATSPTRSTAGCSNYRRGKPGWAVTTV